MYKIFHTTLVGPLSDVYYSPTNDDENACKKI